MKAMDRYQYQKEMGLKIKQARVKKGMTQTDLARALGLKSSSYICEVESGKRPLLSHRLYLITKAIGPILK